MRAIKLGVTVLAAAAFTAAPAGTASADTTCPVATSDGDLCVTADVGCVIGSLKGYQYIQPCVRIDRP